MGVGNAIVEALVGARSMDGSPLLLVELIEEESEEFLALKVNPWCTAGGTPGGRWLVGWVEEKLLENLNVDIGEAASAIPGPKVKLLAGKGTSFFASGGGKL